MTRKIVLGREVLVYELVRKNVKRINLRVRTDGSVTVSASRRVPVEMIESFLREKEKFLMEAIQKAAERKCRETDCAEGSRIPYLGSELTLHFEKGGRYRAVLEGNILRLQLRMPEDRERREKALARWKQAVCAELADRLLQRWYPVLQPCGVPVPSFRFREMSSRWGSCIPKKQMITLNTRLLDYPESCFEYVLLHELCHFLQPDHSPKFYEWMDRVLPDWRQRRKLLR